MYWSYVKNSLFEGERSVHKNEYACIDFHLSKQVPLIDTREWYSKNMNGTSYTTTISFEYTRILLIWLNNFIKRFIT